MPVQALVQEHSNVIRIKPLLGRSGRLFYHAAACQTAPKVGCSPIVSTTKT